MTPIVRQVQIFHLSLQLMHQVLTHPPMQMLVHSKSLVISLPKQSNSNQVSGATSVMVSQTTTIMPRSSQQV